MKTQLGTLVEALDRPSEDAEKIRRIIRSIERTVSNALAQYPGNDYLLASEADFAEILKDHERARSSLREAFDNNSRSPYIATRLSKTYKSLNRIDDAVQVLRAAVTANPSDRRLHFSFAMILRDSGSDEVETMLYHLNRSRAPDHGDIEAEFGTHAICT